MIAGFADRRRSSALVCTVDAPTTRVRTVGPGGIVRRRLRGGCWPSRRAQEGEEIWFLFRQYDADEALAWLVNTVVPLAQLEQETVAWCREMLAMSPFALRLMKASFNASEDGLSGIQQLAHDANLLFYENSEAQEGRDAYREKRRPDFSRFPRAVERDAARPAAP